MLNTKFYFSIIILLSFSSEAIFCQSSNTDSTVSVSDFGAISNDIYNDRDEINKALIHCKENKIAKLFFPPGKYILSHPDAIKLMEDVMDLKMGVDPEKIIFTPYFPYIKGLDISNQSNLELIGQGVELIFKGWMEPISIENSKNIIVNGFTIDYERQPHSEGRVINIGSKFFDVAFNDDYQVKSSMVMPRIMFWDNTKNRLHKDPIYFPEKNELIEPQVLRIWSKIPQSYANSTALINHSFHFRPSILLHESSDIILENVTIHSQPGMGILGHRSHNILMKGLRVVPRAGKKMSTNTDATHFTSCTGFIRFKNCTFEAQGDDATNVHNYYYTITGQVKDKYITRVDAPTGTHAQVLDYPTVGDTLELVDKYTLKVKKQLFVTSVDTFPMKWETHLSFDKKLPANFQDYLLINVSRLPSLHMEGCTILSHLARGVLIKTRNVIIENSTILETTGTAIHIGAEGGWHEGPGSANVIIRNNRILRCGRGAGTQNGASGIAVNVKSEKPSKSGVHKNLLFENNIIEGENAKYGIYVTGAENVTIRYNQITGCEIPVYINKTDEKK